jgi:hypothetical protein
MEMHRCELSYQWRIIIIIIIIIYKTCHSFKSSFLLIDSGRKLHTLFFFVRILLEPENILGCCVRIHIYLVCSCFFLFV